MINRAGLKKNPAVCHLQKTHFRHRETKRLKGKDGAICHRNNRPKKNKTNVGIPDKTNFRTVCKRQRTFYVNKRKM